MLARRSVSGSRLSAWSRAALWDAIAPVVSLVLETRFARSSLREAIAVTSLDEFTTKTVNDC